MSGGYFDYEQYKIGQIADSVKEVIIKNKVERPKEDLDRWCFNDDGTVNEYYKYHHDLSDDIINEFKNGYKALMEAQIYAQRIGYLLSGDDSEESFKKRLGKELDKFYQKFHSGECFNDLNSEDDDDW